MPEFVKEALAREAARFGNYPQIAGTQDWREAAAAWVAARFGLPSDRISPDRHVLPLNGTRDGLFSVLFPFVPQQKAGQQPCQNEARSLTFHAGQVTRRDSCGGQETLDGRDVRSPERAHHHERPAHA